MRLKRKALDVPPPFVPMADLAFNLVLFFIILAKVTDDRDIRWTPAAAPQVTQVPQSRVSVAVDEDGKVYLNGREVGLRQLSGEIAGLLGDAPKEQRAVLLKVHRETLASTFEPIMEAVSQAGGDVVHVLQDERKK